MNINVSSILTTYFGWIIKGLLFRYQAILLSKRSISLTKQYTALYARISVMEALYTRTVVIGLNTVLGRLEVNEYPYLIVLASVNVL